MLPAVPAWAPRGALKLPHPEAAFAMLAGTAPIQASSGQVIRHRLNRGGDRQLDRALHTIIMIRECYHQPTRRYVARGIAEARASARSAVASSALPLASCSVSWSGKLARVMA